MFTTLLAYEIRSRYRADARSFGAFIAVIAIAAGIVAAGLPGISGSTAMLAYALCALTRRMRDRGPGRLLEDPLRAARLLHDEPADLRHGHLLGESESHRDRVPPGPRPGRWGNHRGRGVCRVERRHQPRRVHGRTAFPRGRNTHLHRVPHDRRAAHPCDVVGRAGLRRHDDRRGRALQSYGFRRTHHRFRPAVHCEPGASTVGTFFLPLSVTTDGHFSTEIMWTSYRATMGTDGYPNVIGIGSYVLVPLFALILGAWASRSIEKHTSLR